MSKTSQSAELTSPVTEVFPPKVGANLDRKICYVLQGGGALGAFQLGAYEALDGFGYTPDMIVGISIGAINAAIIAGNPPEQRVARLQTFWQRVTTEMCVPLYFEQGLAKFHNWLGAQRALALGQPGFFKPRAATEGAAVEDLSFYDTSPLRENLLELIDWDYLNAKHVRLCLGAVELESGEFIFFDSQNQQITVEHIMASSALPPSFPAVKIDGHYYVDGGIFSNTPIFKVIDEFHEHPGDVTRVLCFMIDLFSAKGHLPKSIDGMLERVKDIQYSSHSKRSGALYATAQNLSHALKFLSQHLTEEAKQDPKVQSVLSLSFANQVDVVHLIYRSPRGSELNSKAYNFSKEMSKVHRDLGYSDTKSVVEKHHKDWETKHGSRISVYTKEGTFTI